MFTKLSLDLLTVAPALTRKNILSGTSLVAQWLMPMQGTRVRALVREDPICRGATKPVHHNYGACTLESVSYNY